MLCQCIWGCRPAFLGDVDNIAKISTLQTVPVCSSEPNLGNNFNYNTELLPASVGINGQELQFLPAQVLNAVRLGQGELSACYTASFSAPESATSGPLTMTLFSAGVLLNISQHAGAARDFGFSVFDLRLQGAAAEGQALSDQKPKIKNQKFA